MLIVLIASPCIRGRGRVSLAIERRQSLYPKSCAGTVVFACGSAEGVKMSMGDRFSANRRLFNSKAKVEIGMPLSKMYKERTWSYR